MKKWVWMINPGGRQVEVDETLIPELLKKGFKECSALSDSSFVGNNNRADLNLVTLLWASNGMGRVGEEVLLSLDKLGLKIKVLPDYVQEEGLQPRTLELIKLSDKYTKAKITLYYAVPKILPRDLSVKNYLHIDWDTTIAPDIWVKNINQYIDKVYPSTNFVQNVFRESGINKPMLTIHHGVRSDRFPKMERNWEGDFVFLTAGDLSLRKGTDLLIEAFEETFPKEKDVKLIIKSNHEMKWGKIEIPNDPRIEVIEESYPYEKYLNLLEKANCYVVSSRAEGFCLPALEAMSTGLPTIIHNWSGMADLVNGRYNFPVESGELRKAEKWHYPEEYQDGKGIGDWRSPLVADLVKQMRYVYENREKAKLIGEKASDWTRREWDWDSQVRKMWMDIVESNLPQFRVNNIKTPVAKERKWGEFYEKTKVDKETMRIWGTAQGDIFRFIKAFNPKTVIEDGCGTASLSGFLSWDENIKVTAVDFDKQIVEMAKKNMATLAPNLKVSYGDSFKNNLKADVIFSQGMLEHFSNEQMVALVTNELKNAPVVIHSVPNNDYGKLDFGNERLLTDLQYQQIFRGFDLTIYRYWLDDGKKKQSILIFKRLTEPRPRTSIIMPIFNNKEMTITAIEAVRKNTKDYELIAIDNNSNDGIEKWLDEQSDIRTVHLSENLGVPKAKNIGIMIAWGEYICFLDNDTQAGAGWLDDLLAVFKDQTVGFTGTDGWWINKEEKNFMGKQFTHGTEIEWVAHSIFVFPRRLTKKIGLLIDKDLWCIEDVDHCCRIRNLGYKGLMPKEKPNMKHFGASTAGKMTEALTHYNRNCDAVWKEWENFINTRKMGSRIDIGSGDNPNQGYVHVDIQDVPEVDIISLADDLKLPDSSVEEIYSSHLIEHFTRTQLDTVLQEWRRVLKKGGTVVIKTPDILKVCEKLLHGKVDYHLGISWIYGGQRTKWDFHYWSWTFEKIREKLEANGFTNIEHLNDPDDWLKVRATCDKKFEELTTTTGGSKIPLNIIFEGNHHHIYGGGENMTFGVIKILDDNYSNVEVKVDLKQIDAKRAFGIDLAKLTKKNYHLNDVFICISHFSLPTPIGKKNIAVIFYPQFDWTEPIKNYDKVVAISKYSADAIRQKWGIESVVIPPATDIHKFSPNVEKKKQIISVGRFFWQEGGNNKNQHILIKAFSKMPKDWKLVLVGSVQNQEYFDVLKNMARGLNVEFIHDASFEELTKLYAESKLFWSATGYNSENNSTQEHFGIVAVEALASGCKTLVFDGGGMAEITGTEKWKTIDELVKLSLDDTNYNPKLLAEGVKEYSFEEVAKKWKELIKNL